jgi:hypothetical protein
MPSRAVISISFRMYDGAESKSYLAVSIPARQP